MRRIGTVFRDSVSQINRYLGLMLVTNFSGTVLSIPVFLFGLIGLQLLSAGPVLPVALVTLIAVFPSPAVAGVQYVAHETANRNQLLWRDQIDGVRHYGLLALRCWAISSMVGGALALNAAFYAGHHSVLSEPMVVLCLLLLAIWALTHLYVYPLIIEQEEKRVFLIYRNALLIVFSRPGFSLVVGAVWLFVLYVFSFTALVAVFGLILCAQIQQNAAAAILPTFRPHEGEPSEAS